jgi:hypothetical protein
LKKERFILFSDRKLESDLRDGFVSGEAPPAGHNGDIWPRAATKHGANPAAKNSRFLLGDSMRSNLQLSVAREQGGGKTKRPVLFYGTGLNA